VAAARDELHVEAVPARKLDPLAVPDAHPDRVVPHALHHTHTVIMLCGTDSPRPAEIRAAGPSL
jgi:hypothetical protein